MNTELKPCPFCGGEAFITRAAMEYVNYYAQCRECRAKTQWYAKENDAAEAWNRRVDNDA